MPSSPRLITSPANPRIKELLSLQSSSGRRASGLSLVEGVRPAREALGSASTQLLVLIQELAPTPAGEELAKLAQEHAVEILLVSRAAYQKFSRLETPEGAAAVIRPSSLPLAELFTPDCRLIAADGLQDPGNAGAIVRVAEAAGAGGCLFLDGVDPTHPRFLRAAMGSAFRLPCLGVSRSDLLDQAHHHGVRILAAEASPSALPYQEVDYRPPVVICLGGEGAGLSGLIRERADQLISIAMAPPVESLNVAVAAGIILYQTGWILTAGKVGRPRGGA